MSCLLRPLDNCEVLGENCRWSTVTARAVRVFGSASGSSSKGQGQAAVVGRAGVVHTFRCGDHCVGLCNGKGWLQTHT